MERIQAQLSVLAPISHDACDPLGRIGADQGDLGATLGAELIEEPLQRLGVPARVGPQQDPRFVVHDHSEVLVPALVADLIDPDPGQSLEPVGLGLRVRDHHRLAFSFFIPERNGQLVSGNMKPTGGTATGARHLESLKNLSARGDHIDQCRR